MEVDDATALIMLGDLRGGQVAVERSIPRYVYERLVTRQQHGDRFVTAFRFALTRRKAQREDAFEFRRHVAAQVEYGTATALLVFRA